MTQQGEQHMPTKNLEEIRTARAGEITAHELLDSDALAATLRLGIAVRDAREQAGLTQTQLANKLNVAQSAVSRIEAGRTNPSVRTLVAIAAALGVAIILCLGDQQATLKKAVS
jgi:ribosome-binding protein aMBF1 (putative translation factor)